MLAYTQRFLSLAAIIRELSARLSQHEDHKEALIQQIENLRLRINLIKAMQALGVCSILCCMISMLFLFADQEAAGRTAFVLSMVLMVCSLLFSLWEILLSGNALKIELEGIRKAGNC